MVKDKADYSIWFVAVVACVAVVGLISVMGGYRAEGSSLNGITANVISEVKEEVKVSSAASISDEPEYLPEPVYVYIMPDSQSVKKGDDVTVSVNVAGANNLYSFQLDIAYNPNVLELVQKQVGDGFTKNNQLHTYCIPSSDSLGLIANLACTRLGAVEGLSGNGALEVLTFKAVGSGESSIALQNVKLSNPDSGNILLAIINGRVRVK